MTRQTPPETLDDGCDDLETEAAFSGDGNERDDAGGEDQQHGGDERPPTKSAPAQNGLAALRPEKDDDGYLFHYPRLHMEELPFAERDRAVAKGETEALLNGLIGECGSLLRDVAFRSACLTPDAADRLRFISAAESLALTAAKVADTIARLRHGEPQTVDAHRHELVYTHVHTSPHPPAAGSDVQ